MTNPRLEPFVGARGALLRRRHKDMNDVLKDGQRVLIDGESYTLSVEIEDADAELCEFRGCERCRTAYHWSKYDGWSNDRCAVTRRLRKHLALDDACQCCAFDGLAAAELPLWLVDLLHGFPDGTAENTFSLLSGELRCLRRDGRRYVKESELQDSIAHYRLNQSDGVLLNRWGHEQLCQCWSDVLSRMVRGTF